MADGDIRYEWDEAKSRQTQKRRGFGFVIMGDFDWDFAVCVDIEAAAGEMREKWLGPIDAHLYMVVVTCFSDVVRVISLRRATNREIAFWRREIRT